MPRKKAQNPRVSRSISLHPVVDALVSEEGESLPYRTASHFVEDLLIRHFMAKKRIKYKKGDLVRG